ncbi:MAG: HEAT repeat domain-containing protein [Aphanocapsa sp. GSE-SYN-MK-11-07L]|jgi:predicted NACHT family NTPase|nr:HEAT repeat domain-containing protein [Aphanocapsa sp. GSE-SYN-MK-11-07L]
MSSVNNLNFQSYLKSICSNEDLPRWQEFYTPTDALNRQSLQGLNPKKPPLLDLRVQRVEIKDAENSQQEPQEKIERLPILEGICKYASEHVLLVGRPGSGKSTALERLLLEKAEQALIGHSSQIPVLVKLRSTGTIFELIEAFLKKHDTEELLDLNQETLDLLLHQGKLFLLIDGLNELPSALAQQTESAQQKLKKFQGHYSKTPMIVTTRDLGWSNDMGIKKKLEMLPLTEAQMRQFVGTYLGEKNGSSLLRQLDQRLRKFGETPLLLWMLCSVYQSEGRVPSNLGAMFQKFADIYANKLKGDVQVHKASKSLWLRLLQQIAFAMMPQDDPHGLRLSISRHEAEDLLTEYLKKNDWSDPRNLARTCLEDLLKHHLITPKNHDEIEFCHQLIQEYYSAEYLLAELRHSMINLELFQCYLNYWDWTESIALLIKLVDDEQQAIQIVKLALNVDLMLGSRLAGEAKLEFQERTVDLVVERDIPTRIKIQLLSSTRSEFAIPVLCQFLSDSNHWIRQDAASALGKINSEISIKILTKTMYDESDDESLVGFRAALALATINSETAIRALVNALSSEKFDIRLSAAQVLGETGRDDVVEDLIQTLEDEDDRVGWCAASSLWRIGIDGSELAVEALNRILSSNNPDVYSKATYALDEIAYFPTLVVANQAKEDKQMEITGSNLYERINQETDVKVILKILQDSGDVFSTSTLGRVGRPQLLSCLSKFLLENKNVEIFETIAAIQSRCKFYNYEVFQAAQKEVEVRNQTSEEQIATQVYIGIVINGPVHNQTGQVGIQNLPEPIQSQEHHL